MTVIQIKRSTGATAPTTNDLAEGELAYSEDRSGNGASAVLYIESVASDGTTAVIDKVGGKYYTNTVDDFLTPDTTTVGAKVTLYEGSTNGTNYVQLKAPDSVASNLILTLPGADGSNGHILTTNGSGVLSFQAPASSSLTLAGDTGTDTFSTGQTLTFTGGTGLDSAVTDNTVTFNIDSTVTTNSGTQTLTNKSLSDSTTFFIDETDGTKKMQFQLSGITTATTRTVTVPDADLTLVGTATTQTLTNKTLTSPTLTTPVLGTPSSGTLTNCTGLPISTGVSGLGTGVATFLATPSSANLVAAMTDETGSGALYFVGGALGTPSSATLTNATGLPVSGITSSTSAALGLGSIELGHATDTTISRVSAGVVAIEGVNVVTTSSTDTLTNKTLTAPKIANAGFIADANGNEQLIFTTTASAVNEITVANAATGNAPSLTASGETNVSLNLRAKGTGTVNVGSTGLSVSGSTSGTTTLVSAATASGSLTLPSATDTLVGRATTDTLTNKTINGSSNTITNVSLTSGVTGTLPVANGGTGITSFGTGVATFLGTPSSANLAAAVTDETGTGALVFANTPTLTTPVIAEIDATADLTLDAAGDIVLDADGADVILKDAGVTFGALTNSGGELVIKSGSSSTTAITMSGANVTVSGNLTVNGTSTIVNSTTVSVDDALLKLGADNAANSVDTGFYTEYIASTVQKWAGLFKDASDGDKWKLFKDLQAEPTTTVNTAGTGYTIGTLVANLEGGTVSGLSADIAVADGGTGASTFTTNGVLYGAGTGAIQATAAGTNGYILYSNSGTPAWTNVIDGGTY